MNYFTGHPPRRELICSKAVAISKISKHSSRGRYTKGWFYSFMKRHDKSISQKKSKKISKAMSLVNWTDVTSWRTRLTKYLEDHNLIHLLNDPRRIGNADEANFSHETKPGLVVSGSGEHSFETENAAAKRNVTVLCCALASGEYITPFTIFSGTSLSSKLRGSSASTGLKCIVNPKGWMDCDSFLFWLQHVLYPELVDMCVEFPFILTVDGFAGHKSEIIAKTCMELKIILVLLPPNTTHVLQPLDNGFFGPIKKAWDKLLKKQKEHNVDFKLSDNNFLELFKILYTTYFDPKYAKQAFKCTGIFPWAENAINRKKILGFSQKPESISEELNQPSNATLDNPIEAIYMNINNLEYVSIFKNCY